MLDNNHFQILRTVFDANPTELAYFDFNHKLHFTYLEQAFKDTFYEKFGEAGVYIGDELYNRITDKYSEWELECFASSYRHNMAA